MSPQKQYFNFIDIPDFKDFHFERLAAKNALALFSMFQFDDNPFTDERFKNLETCEEYCKLLENYYPYTPKHAGQDWLWKIKDDYAGILHLYDLSRETFGKNHKRCWVGFATNQYYRNKGLTSAVLLHFVNHIFSAYTFIDFIHAMTLKENIPAQNFLLKNGFQKDMEERISQKHLFFIQTRSSLS